MVILCQRFFLRNGFYFLVMYIQTGICVVINHETVCTADRVNVISGHKILLTVYLFYILQWFLDPEPCESSQDL